LPKTKNIPLRRCVVCGEMKPKTELIRAVKSPEGEISLDTSGRANGRGAYVCNSGDCISKIRKTRRIEKSFGMRVPEEVFETIEKLQKN
jgi:predicted RNA-binding protein YlxR (DUF448 family)